MKSRKHSFVISVTFNKPCSKKDALAAVRDCIHGDFYPTAFEDEHPDKMKVRSFRPERAAS